MLRTIGAVAAGCGSMSALTVAASQFVRLGLSRRLDADTELAALALVVVLVATAVAVMAGSFLAARMAPQHPLFHALLVGSIAYVLSMSATSILWTEAPAWFHMAVVLIQLPAALVGGLLTVRKHPALTPSK
jgi:hypothetical protein